MTVREGSSDPSSTTITAYCNGSSSASVASTRAPWLTNGIRTQGLNALCTLNEAPGTADRAVDCVSELQPSSISPKHEVQRDDGIRQNEPIEFHRFHLLPHKIQTEQLSRE